MLVYLKKHPAVFDPNEVRVLTEAFDQAWQLMEASGAKFENDSHAEEVREVLAKHIIEAARQGERDSQRLIEAALVGYTQVLQRAALRTKPPTEGT
jgi:hypothetical protein